jgi:hypothetical protein
MQEHEVLNSKVLVLVLTFTAYFFNEVYKSCRTRLIIVVEGNHWDQGSCFHLSQSAPGNET